MRLDLSRSAPKISGSFDRTVDPRETLAAEGAIRERCGITRVAELTHLDRIGLPVFAAIVPGARDAVSVYSGKGTTREAARAGAIMEAAERYAAGASDETLGYDLIGAQPARVPLKYPRGSNGFASGNTLTEAVYHALCELIERHVLAVAHAIGHERPRAMMERFLGVRLDIPGFVDDVAATEFDVPTGSSIIDELFERIVAAGFSVRLRAVELSPFPMVFIATITEMRDGIPHSCLGFGCSLAPEHAAIRALTEAAQARLTNIQTAREDFPVSSTPSARAVPQRIEGHWYFDAPVPRSTLQSLTDRSSRDLARDVDTIVSTLRAAGCERAVIVDVSPPGLPVRVVRAVVPGFETTLTDGAIGPTIARILDPTLSQELRLSLC